MNAASQAANRLAAARLMGSIINLLAFPNFKSNYLGVGPGTGVQGWRGLLMVYLYVSVSSVCVCVYCPSELTEQFVLTGQFVFVLVGGLRLEKQKCLSLSLNNTQCTRRRKRTHTLIKARAWTDTNLASFFHYPTLSLSHTLGSHTHRLDEVNLGASE